MRKNADSGARRRHSNCDRVTVLRRLMMTLNTRTFPANRVVLSSLIYLFSIGRKTFSHAIAMSSPGIGYVSEFFRGV